MHTASMWLLASSTLGSVPSEHLPPWAREQGPLHVAIWQWLGVLPLLALAWGVGRIVASALVRLALPGVRRAQMAWIEALLLRARGPLTLVAMVGAAYLLLPLLDLGGRAEHVAQRALFGALVFAAFWSAWRAVDVVARRLESDPRVHAEGMSRALVSLLARFSKLVLFVLGVVTALQQLGFQVGSMLAGLGIGGLAFALAAQKTLEHLFGSLTLGLDRPLTAGDLVKVEDLVGTVEHIGLRSTRIRTADRTLVSIPNGKLADLRIENFASRDRIRVAAKLQLSADQPRERIESFLEQLRAQVGSTPGLSSGSGSIALVGLADGVLTVELTAMFEGTDVVAFNAFREALFLEALALAERLGVRWSGTPRPS